MATPDDARDSQDDATRPRFDLVLEAERSTPVEPLIHDQPRPLQDLEQAPNVRVRAFSLTDLPGLIRFPAALRLDLPDSLVMRRSNLDLASALPFVRRDRPLFVAVADGQLVGYVRFSPRRPDERWVVSTIAASTGVYSPEPVWHELLRHGVWAAGLRGVRRVFARVPAGHPLIRLMRQDGWIAYASETIFVAECPRVSASSPPRMRVQQPSDAWAIHQLYIATVPRQVQEIEALTSHVWHMDRSRKSRRISNQSGWLLEENSNLTGYARYARGPRAGLLDFLVQPGDHSSLSAVLDGVIAGSGGMPGGRTYCALRGYLSDLETHLIDRGFAAVGEQELLMRYTTATVRTPPLESVHFPVELRPAIPRRVPTFLEGQAPDSAL
jgi:hypothetical protein